VVNQASSGDGRRNRSLLVGGVLIGIGGLLGFTGMVLIGSALVSVTRRRLNQLDPPPRELARLKLRQAKLLPLQAGTHGEAKRPPGRPHPDKHLRWQDSPWARESIRGTDAGTRLGVPAWISYLLGLFTYAPSRPVCCRRWIAWLREEAPSLR
jgi:hypothetical protein